MRLMYSSRIAQNYEKFRQLTTFLTPISNDSYAGVEIGQLNLKKNIILQLKFKAFLLESKGSRKKKKFLH